MAQESTSQKPASSAAAAALAAFKSGGNPFKAAFGVSSADATKGSANGVDTTDPADANRDDELSSDDSGELDLDETGNDDLHEVSDADDDESDDADPDVQDDESEDEDGDEESEDDAATGEADDGPASDVEDIEIMGADGKKRPYKIDYNDRDTIKRAFHQAAGMRKFQRERDDANKELAALKSSGSATASEDAANFQKLAAAWEKDGIAGLVATLTQGKQSWDQVYDAESAKRKQVASMTAPELAAYKRQQEADEAVRAAKAREEAADKKIAELTEKETSAETATFTSYMNDAFTRSRFAGKLGDAAREHELDEMLWDGTKAAIERLPDDVVVTPQLIRKEFARREKALRGTIEAGVRKETGKVMKQKKVEAKTQAQAQMKSSSRPSTREAEMRKAIRSGNFVSAVTSFLGGSSKSKSGKKSKK